MGHSLGWVEVYRCHGHSPRWPNSNSVCLTGTLPRPILATWPGLFVHLAEVALARALLYAAACNTRGEP